MKKLVNKFSTLIPALAFVFGVLALNSACLASYHQPEISPSLDEYRK